MKRHLFCRSAVFIFILLFSSAAIQAAGKFSYTPERPKAGEEIVIKYNAEGTGLSGAEKPEMVAYLYSVDLDETRGVEMKKEGNLWTASLTTSPSTRGILIKFKSGDDFDNNKGKGFVINLYGSSGKEVPGTYAGLAAARGIWGPRYLEMERDREGANKLFLEEFKKNPQVKAEYLEMYFSVISPLMGEKANSIIAKELLQAEKKPVDSEEYLSFMSTWYGSIKNAAKSAQYRKALLEKYPAGKYAQAEKYNEIEKTSDLNKKLEMTKSFEASYPESEYIPELYHRLASLYLEKKMLKEAGELLKNNPGRILPYTFYIISGGISSYEEGDISLAGELAVQGVEKGRQDLSNAGAKKPKFLSLSEWQQEQQYPLGLNLYGLGKIQNKMGKKDEAIASLSEALGFLRNTESSADELYASLLIEKGENEKALRHLEQVIQSGNGTPQMRDYLKTAYTGKNGGENGFNEYVSRIDQAAKDNLLQKLKKEMLNDKAPDFKLKDLDGKEVSLSSLKGKTVVLDFWATWCPPCRASFPGMKKAVEKYSANPDVRFIFIDTRERVEDKKKNAADFLAKNQYPFYVLLDTESKVNELFKVPGIPTKIVIDKDGMIRFKVVGFGGNIEQMLEEIDAMIALAN